MSPVPKLKYSAFVDRVNKLIGKPLSEFEIKSLERDAADIPDNVQRWRAFGMLYSLLSKPEEVKEYFEKAIAFEPTYVNKVDFVTSLMNCGCSYSAANEALKVYKDCHEFSDMAICLLAFGSCGYYDELAELMDRVVKEYSNRDDLMDDEAVCMAVFLLDSFEMLEDNGIDPDIGKEMLSSVMQKIESMEGVEFASFVGLPVRDGSDEWNSFRVQVKAKSQSQLYELDSFCEDMLIDAADSGVDITKIVFHIFNTES